MNIQHISSSHIIGAVMGNDGNKYYDTLIQNDILHNISVTLLRCDFNKANDIEKVLNLLIELDEIVEMNECDDLELREMELEHANSVESHLRLAKDVTGSIDVQVIKLYLKRIYDTLVKFHCEAQEMNADKVYFDDEELESTGNNKFQLFLGWSKENEIFSHDVAIVIRYILRLESNN